MWDAAAKVDGRSLNSCLFTGPDPLNKPVPEVIERLKEREVGCSGDVTDSIFPVGSREEDRNALSFIWLDRMK